MNPQVSSNRLRDEQSIRCENKDDSPWAGGLRTHVIGAGNKSIPAEKIHTLAGAEVAARKGHDLFMFPWPPAEFQHHVIDHTEVYEKVAFQYGSIPQIAFRSTFNPKTKKHFAFADSWIPSPLHYFEDYWGEVGMPLGPVHYGSLLSGGQRIRAKLGVPCGLAITPTLEGNIALHTLLYAFRGQILDQGGNVAINKNAFTINALKYVKALSQDAGTPEQLTWGSSGNVQAMLARKASCTTNAISLLRFAEKLDPETAKKIRLQPPLLGSAGITAFPHVTNCSAIWNFTQNQEGAKQFLGDLVDHSKTIYENSKGCNFPVYAKTVPDLIVRLENDPEGDPPYKYKELKDALHWTPNLGAPGFAHPVWMEVFNSFVVPRMFMSVTKGELSAEDAARVVEGEVTKIAEKWKHV
jgi:multiple sugar transport system substrate-binding protein